jgi:hypothetical protein
MDGIPHTTKRKEREREIMGDRKEEVYQIFYLSN